MTHFIVQWLECIQLCTLHSRWFFIYIYFIFFCLLESTIRILTLNMHFCYFFASFVLTSISCCSCCCCLFSSIFLFQFIFCLFGMCARARARCAIWLVGTRATHSSGSLISSDGVVDEAKNAYKVKFPFPRQTNWPLWMFTQKLRKFAIAADNVVR